MILDLTCSSLCALLSVSVFMNSLPYLYSIILYLLSDFLQELHVVLKSCQSDMFSNPSRVAHDSMPAFDLFPYKKFLFASKK